uniref:competence protein ComJ n=1 Tax=Candidatus Electronema sp. TaxID=2698783 RepID=UPI004055B495
MNNLSFEIYLSYSQLCIFSSSIENPFNYWSERNFSQGFSWRPFSVSFRALTDEGEYKIFVYIEDDIPDISIGCIRSFRVPFEVQSYPIEIGSISDTKIINLPKGKYILQVEFLKITEGMAPEVNIRLNFGETDFLILKNDDEIVVNGDFDLMAMPAN